MFTVFGAGSIGTVLAAALSDAGVDVAIAGRRAVSALRVEGDEECIEADVDVVDEPRGTILLCVHETDVASLAARWPDRTLVTFANGVTAERDAARTCAVIGGVWRMTCTWTAPGRALFTRRGRIVVGPWSDGVDVQPVADALRAARFDVGVSEEIEADLWLKLLCNIGSTPNAIVRGADHGDPRFGALKADLVREAWEVLQARGMRAASCDGRDASPEEEIERQRHAGPRARPVYNDTWRQLHRGQAPKQRYHKTIADLGHAPRNARMDALLLAAAAPECYTLDEVLV
ncbi:MAG: 2-dehydropantoate 2-reductase N-terminal domain-containing protein [Planctomycetota bacterium]